MKNKQQEVKELIVKVKGALSDCLSIATNEVARCEKIIDDLCEKYKTYLVSVDVNATIKNNKVDNLKILIRYLNLYMENPVDSVLFVLVCFVARFTATHHQECAYIVNEIKKTQFSENKIVIKSQENEHSNIMLDIKKNVYLIGMDTYDLIKDIFDQYLFGDMEKEFVANYNNKIEKTEDGVKVIEWLNEKYNYKNYNFNGSLVDVLGITSKAIDDFNLLSNFLPMDEKIKNIIFSKFLDYVNTIIKDLYIEGVDNFKLCEENTHLLYRFYIVYSTIKCSEKLVVLFARHAHDLLYANIYLQQFNQYVKYNSNDLDEGVYKFKCKFSL